MPDFDTISTETWKARVPSDWSERNCSSSGSLYFEAADGSKGAYFSTWRFEDDPRSAIEILESIRRVEVNSFAKMERHTWQCVDEWATTSPELDVLGVDYLERQRNYRIACKLMVSLPWVVCSSFHDYDCADYEVSKRFFQPIIDSVTIHHEVA